jgi:betaine lipid synthase
MSTPPPNQAKEKVRAKGWTNVHVVEGDACEFRVPEGEAQLVTFSYSLSSEWLVW